MAIETIFKTLDQDEDGFIGIEDVVALNEDLGSCFDKEGVAKVMEQISSEGTKIDKQEFAKIFWKWVACDAAIFYCYTL